MALLIKVTNKDHNGFVLVLSASISHHHIIGKQLQRKGKREEECNGKGRERDI